MKAIAYIAIYLGVFVLALGAVGLNLAFALIGCVGILAGSAVLNQLDSARRLDRMESQMNTILQAQGRSYHNSTHSWEHSEQTLLDEQTAYNLLKED